MAADPHQSSERYELVERIAVGGMAEVFRAKKYGSHGFAKQMAVKRILPALAADEEFVTRFIAEAKIAVTLSHANIVQVFDFSRFGDSLYIAMEYVDGVDLSDLLVRLRRSGAPIGVAPGLHIAMELLKGLDFAHRKGVIHRDISPSNILLSRAGEIKIADFGIAQAAGLELTRQHRVMGKWPYMSPEQTRGEDLSVATDLFSAGTVLYELLTGERLFGGKNADEIVKAIADREIVPPSERRRELPPGLDAPLLSLLSRDPSRRPKAGEVQTRLVEVSYESTVQATAASLADQIERIVPKRDGDDTGSNKLLDDIINSELSNARGGRRTRVTLEAAEVSAAELAEETALSFIKTTTGHQGLSEWVVGDATGTYQLKRTDRLFALGGRPAGRAQTIVDATSGASGAASEDESPARRRRRWPVVASLGVVSAIGVVIATQMAGGAREPGEAALETVDAGGWTADAPTVQARLAVDSVPPGARVSIDGRDLGPTPLEIASPSVNVTLELRRDGYEPCVVSVDAGATAAISCELALARARITVITEPAGASVSIGDESLGETPLRDVAVEPRPGSTTITIRKRGYRTVTQRLALAAGSTATLQKELDAQAETGKIDIYSEPWANVYFRGKKIGVAPVRGLVLPAGKHRVTLVNPVQNRRTTITVSIPDGKKRYKVTLP